MKSTKNKRLLKARAEHQSWLEARGLSRIQIRKRKKNFSEENRLPDLHVDQPELSNSFDKTQGKNTIMEQRYRESPAVRAEIERKAMRVGQTVNKSNYGYVSDGDLTKYQGRVRK